jgi:hypothetical protein
MKGTSAPCCFATRAISRLSVLTTTRSKSLLSSAAVIVYDNAGFPCRDLKFLPGTLFDPPRAGMTASLTGDNVEVTLLKPSMPFSIQHEPSGLNGPFQRFDSRFSKLTNQRFAPSCAEHARGALPVFRKVDIHRACRFKSEPCEALPVEAVPFNQNVSPGNVD